MLTSQSKKPNEPKQVIPKRQILNRPLEIKLIWTFDTEFLSIFNKTITYITFKSAVKHRQASYGYPRGQTCPTRGISDEVLISCLHGQLRPGTFTTGDSVICVYKIGRK